jgi:hypothetical protein
MGETTMSHAEKWIEQWRAGLAGSELLGSSDVNELESHLREEMEHLKTTGLSDEEAFLVARHRLGDTATLEQEFAKVAPHRRFAKRLSWMAIGVLGYFLALHLSLWATNASTMLGYVAGLRTPHLTFLACAIQVTAFAVIGALAWRYLSSRSASRTTRRMPVAACVSLFAACAIVALWLGDDFLFRYLLIKTMPIQEYSQFAMASGWASVGWGLLMPFLIAGLIALLALRDRRHADAQ